MGYRYRATLGFGNGLRLGIRSNEPEISLLVFVTDDAGHYFDLQTLTEGAGKDAKRVIAPCELPPLLLRLSQYRPQPNQAADQANFTMVHSAEDVTVRLGQSEPAALTVDHGSAPQAELDAAGLVRLLFSLEG